MINPLSKAYYSRNLTEHGDSAKGVGWKDTESQETRFAQLEKVIYSQGPILNDLGCGTGDLFPYLKSRLDKFTYRGYDIMQEMVNRAVSRHIDQGATFFLIGKSSEMKEADYTLASGIFNLKFGESEKNWKDYIVETLHVMDIKSTKGFAFNALTSYSDPEYMKPELFYSDPLWLFHYCKQNFAKNVALLHDYSMYDFTILVKKNF